MESSLGELLRRFRAAACVTQEGLADRTGLSVQAISALERGFRTLPRQATLGLLADALDLDDEQRQALLTAASGGRRRPGRQAPSVPRQLPYATADFTGRRDEIKQLMEALTAGRVVTITGMGGVGKTALAVQIGHQVAALYPDGQIYLDLHGYGAGSPVPESEAIRAITRSLGAEDAPDAAMSAERLRVILGDRRMLLMLDNVVDAAHVADLLVDLGASTAIVTSRRVLTSLVGAVHTHLDVLSEPEALDMLGVIAGADRLSREPDAASRVIGYCGHLPLAIRVAAARLAARPAWPIAHLVDRLDDERNRLDELEVADLGVRAIRFAVDRQSADAVGKLSLPDWHDISTTVAARLLDLPESAAAEALQLMVDANLLTATRPGFYRQHDLLRVYGRDHAAKELSETSRVATSTRALDLYVAVAWWVKLRIRPPSAMDTSWGDPVWTACAPTFADTAEGMAWLDAERGNIVSAALQAVLDPALNSHYAVRLALGLHEYLISRHDWDASRRLFEAALSGGPDPTAEFLLRYCVSGPYGELGLYDEAISRSRECVKLAEMLRRPNAQELSLLNIGWLLTKADRPAEAIGYADRAFRMARKRSDPYVEGYACLVLGMAYGALGMRTDQEAFNRRSHAIFAWRGNEPEMALTLRELGLAHAAVSQDNAALTALHDALEIYHRLNEPGAAAGVLEELGGVHESLGEFEQAMDCLHEGLSIAELHDVWRLEAKLRRRLGNVLATVGRASEARDHWRAALTILDQHGTSTGADELRALLSDAQFS